jgi:hypothetical protein
VNCHVASLKVYTRKSTPLGKVVNRPAVLMSGLSWPDIADDDDPVMDDLTRW